MDFDDIFEYDLVQQIENGLSFDLSSLLVTPRDLVFTQEFNIPSYGAVTLSFGGFSSLPDLEQGRNMFKGLVILWVSWIILGNIKTDLKTLFSPQPKIDIEVEQPVDDAPPAPPTIQTMPQVFHLKDNKYTYENAKAVCKAYGSRLANLEDLQKAHKEGGEWCSYGWSDKQHAYFPTQKKTWDKLQTKKGHEHDCGRPGINGGYIANPNIAFGVNCYGFRPKMNSSSKYSMENQPLYPKTEKELAFEARVKKWRHKTKDLTIAPFNTDQWSVV